MKCSNLSHLKSVMLLILSFALLAIFYSCKRAAEKTSEKAIEKSIGDDAEVDIEEDKLTIKTDEGTFTTDATIHSWPKEIPADIPEFIEGKVVSVTTHEIDEANNWVVIFEDVPKEALEKYKEDLKDHDFKINYTTMAGSGGHLTAEKGKLAVVVMVAEGTATVTIGTNN
ncbi:hypothetical protein [uncultured Eudoraea sp.]|uniref:hypothetical protein n=1 Tax=uncultured Eudoraea sp. TaxID=1035614 RepID=UPI00261E6006|nr:hypothetical protein [uncultured Eudoraea sp.]